VTDNRILIPDEGLLPPWPLLVEVASNCPEGAWTVVITDHAAELARLRGSDRRRLSALASRLSDPHNPAWTRLPDDLALRGQDTLRILTSPVAPSPMATTSLPAAIAAQQIMSRSPEVPPVTAHAPVAPVTPNQPTAKHLYTK